MLQLNTLSTVYASSYENRPFCDLVEGRDETGDADKPGICKKFCHLCNATDVFLAVLGGEAQILVQAMANVVSIQRVARDSMGHQILFKSKTNGCLPSTGQTWWENVRSHMRMWFVCVVGVITHIMVDIIGDVKDLPVSQMVQPLKPPLVPTTWPLLLRLTWWAWYTTLVDLLRSWNTRKQAWMEANWSDSYQLL